MTNNTYLVTLLPGEILKLALKKCSGKNPRSDSLVYNTGGGNRRKKLADRPGQPGIVRIDSGKPCPGIVDGQVRYISEPERHYWILTTSN